MTTIIIKSAIDVPTYHTEEIHSIPEPESLYQKVVRKITKEPRKEHKFVGRVSFDQLKEIYREEAKVAEYIITEADMNNMESFMNLSRL
jgi:hypothetical protein